MSARARELTHTASANVRERVGRRLNRLLRAAVLCLVLSLTVACVAVRSEGGAVPKKPGVFTVGVTHTQETVNRWDPDAAVARAAEVLGEVAPLQNQHLMGWGALSPEPSPGEFEFASLDERMELISSLGGQPVLTLCCAPDWMKGGNAGSTDWSRIEEAPDPEHFDDFARLAQVAAERYPQVRHFLVWNEMKGFFDEDRNEWDAAGYTDLYNRVYEAVKEVRPDALVGGPYVVFDSWSTASATSHPSDVRGEWGVLDQRPLDVVDYWLENSVGADFITVDATTRTKDVGLTTTDFEAVGKLTAVTEWVRSRSDLPIWWAEVYAETDDEEAWAGDPRRAAVMAEAMVAVANAGAAVALLWQPQEDSELNSAALLTDTASADGGQDLPLATLLRAVVDPLASDPATVSTTWDPTESVWTLTTPDDVYTWSPDDGVRGPLAQGEG